MSNPPSPLWGFAERLGCFLVCLAAALFLLAGVGGCRSGARIELATPFGSIGVQFAGPDPTQAPGVSVSSSTTPAAAAVIPPTAVDRVHETTPPRSETKAPVPETGGPTGETKPADGEGPSSGGGGPR